MSVKKILIVANLAGFASFLFSDIEIFQCMGYRITYAANGNALGWEDTKKVLDEKKVKFVQIDFDSKNPFNKKNFQAYLQIQTLLRQEHFDVVHCHTPIVGIIVRLATISLRRKGMKVLYTTHGLSFTSHTTIKEKLVYKTLENMFSYVTDAIITINREDFLNVQKMHCKNVYYIHGVGVDTEVYRDVKIDRASYREKLGVKENDIMILSVGELSARKNHRIIIEALARLENKQRYVYIICGNGIAGGTAKLLEEMAVQLGVRVKLLGFRYDIPEITSCSDIGAIPSTREGLGLSGIQSLAAGIPLVGTDVQGIRDYIEEGNTGFLCDAYSAKDFAVAINRLTECSEVEKNRMKACCYQMAQKFDKAVSKAELQEIYSTILK